MSGSVESSRTEQDDSDILVLKPMEWLVYLPETVGHVVSLVLLKTSKLSNFIIFEARNENIAALKMMEAKIREFLKGKNEALVSWYRTTHITSTLIIHVVCFADEHKSCLIPLQ
jgi:hypothetical protein